MSPHPELLATAYFDGTIGIHTLQSTHDVQDARASAPTPEADGSDVFDVPGFSRTTQHMLSLKQPSGYANQYPVRLATAASLFW